MFQIDAMHFMVLAVVYLASLAVTMGIQGSYILDEVHLRLPRSRDFAFFMLSVEAKTLIVFALVMTTLLLGLFIGKVEVMLRVVMALVVLMALFLGSLRAFILGDAKMRLPQEKSNHLVNS